VSNGMEDSFLQHVATAVESSRKLMSVAYEFSGRESFGAANVATVPLPLVQAGPKSAISNSRGALAQKCESLSDPNAGMSQGNSNVDHIVIQTGDYMIDRIAEMKRLMLQRRCMKKGTDDSTKKWDKARVSGSRRRRIDADPAAPQEPPPSGYVVFVGQMTCKMRHDNGIDLPHNQAACVLEISRLWRYAFTETQRKYYDDFATQLQAEYQKQRLEFRTTGTYTPSSTFERRGTVWLRMDSNQRNEIEHEIAAYESVSFPPRPPSMDEDFQRREANRALHRKLRSRGLDPTTVVDVNAALQQPKRKRTPRKVTVKTPTRKQQTIAPDISDSRNHSEVNDSAAEKSKSG
jgi:hypothetical protein